MQKVSLRTGCSLVCWMQGATGAMFSCSVLCFIHSLDIEIILPKGKRGSTEKPPTPLMGQQDLLWREGPSKLKVESPSALRGGKNEVDLVSK